MKFGIQHPVGDPASTPEIMLGHRVAAFARSAETHGFAAIAFTDHPAPSTAWVDNGGEGVADLFTSLGFAAAVTSVARLMTFVLVPAYRHPLVAAQQIATLDRLSNGRVTVGLGTGYLNGEFRALGLDLADRLDAFDTSVEVMRTAWSTGVVGRTTVKPPVVQQPHPPLWIHGNSRFGIERAGRYGQGWLGMMTGDNDVIVKTIRTTPMKDLDALARRIDAVRQVAVEAGRDPDTIELAVVGLWPVLDVRAGVSADFLLAQIDAVRSLGVTWTVSLCCGDDPSAALDTVAWFGETVISVGDVTAAS